MVSDKLERGQQLKRDGVIIRTWDLRKTYVMGDQEIHAVSGIDIEIKKGEYVVLNTAAVCFGRRQSPGGRGAKRVRAWRPRRCLSGCSESTQGNFQGRAQIELTTGGLWFGEKGFGSADRTRTRNLPVNRVTV